MKAALIMAFFCIAMFLFIPNISYPMGCNPPATPPVEKKIEAPKITEVPAPPVVKKISKPAIIRAEAMNNLKVANIKGWENVITVKLNKQAANRIRKGAKVRVFIGNCYYEGTKVDKSGNVNIQVEWTPPNPSGKIGVQVWQPTSQYGDGYSICSVVVKG